MSETIEIVDILNVPVHCVSPDDILDAIDKSIQLQNRALITYVHLHAINLAQSDSLLREVLGTSLINYCDGEGVRWGARILKKNIPFRIPLTRWIYDVLDHCEKNNHSVYFLGCADCVLRDAVSTIRKKNPSLDIAGFHHGYFQTDKAEVKLVLKELDEIRPDVLFIGMGMPLQELWIKDHWEKLPNSVIMTAGSCFEYIAGAKPRCPTWLADNGLEWFHRLLIEPRKVWKRYLIGIPIFFARILYKRLSRKNR